MKKKKKSAVRRVENFVKNVQRLKQILDLLGLPHSAIYPALKKHVERLIEQIERLPINYEGIATRHPAYFVLVCNEWYPCYGEELRDGWLEAGTAYEDGSKDCGIYRPYRWAHATADNTPNYDWFDSMLREFGDVECENVEYVI